MADFATEKNNFLSLLITSYQRSADCKSVFESCSAKFLVSVMSKPTLYYLPPSPPARAVLLFLRHLEIDVDVKFVDLHNGEQFTEKFLSLNPAHEVPVLVDEDFVLSESRAILQYLANNQSNGWKFYPTEPKARARVDQKLSFDHELFTRSTVVYVSCKKRLNNQYFAPI